MCRKIIDNLFFKIFIIPLFLVSILCFFFVGVALADSGEIIVENGTYDGSKPFGTYGVRYDNIQGELYSIKLWGKDAVLPPISGVEVFVCDMGENSTWNDAVWKVGSQPGCLHASSTEIHSWTLIGGFGSTEEYRAQTLDLPLGEQYTLSSGTNYFIAVGTTVDDPSDAYLAKSLEKFGDEGTGGNFQHQWLGIPYGSDTTGTTVVNVIQLPEYDTSVNIGYKNYLDIAGNYCIVGYPCYIPIYYNFNAIGDTLLLYEDTGHDLIIDDFVASTTLLNNFILKDRFDIASSSSVGEQWYCVKSENLGELYCDINLTWVLETDITGMESDYDVDSACDGLATSSLSYPINCGLRKLSYWLFTPRPEIYLKMRDTIAEFTNNFPISVAKDIQTMFKIMEEVEIVPASIQISWYESDTGIQDLGDVTFSSSTISGVIGEDNYEQYYGWMELIIYLMTFVWLLFRIRRMSDR